MDIDQTNWYELRRSTPEKIQIAHQVLEEVRQGRKVNDALRLHPLKNGGYVGKHMLVAVYRQLVDRGELPEEPRLLELIRMKPVRTLSGVTTVTVLTKPYPCPGKCVFCPTDDRMPKSYLPDEPGARRGLEHQFDPYAQVKSRLEALEAVGHPTDKVELLVLGGTWSAYRKNYQEWFIHRCFDALNGIDEPDLQKAQKRNETAPHKSVGLVIETRPDHITPAELRRLRSYGVTKIQLGVQSLDDRILELNKRGHSVAEIHRAVNLIRAAGFKIVLHWMPNLLGATLETDRQDFSKLWEELCPDEIKIYPTQLLENADLYRYWLDGEYHPYTTAELVNLIADLKPEIPPYCRVNRIIRDIPSTNVVSGNKRTSLRQDVQAELRRRGSVCRCIRCREIRGQAIQTSKLRIEDYTYNAGGAEEHFISFVTDDNRLAGFLRLSLPGAGSPNPGIEEIANAALIREVHVYGQSLPVGAEARGFAQHRGLGKQLIGYAEKIAAKNGFQQIAVIAAIGTRRYYQRQGFSLNDLYMVKSIVHE